MKPRVLLLSSIIIVLICLFAIFLGGTLLSSAFQSKIGESPNDLPSQQVTFQSRSGNKISGWFIPGQADKGGILLMHGVRSNRLQMLERARFLNRDGYSVLLFDFQSHGESSGKHITFGYLESLDANAAFTFLENKLSNKRIGVIGVSLGGAAALLGEVVGKSDAIILESVYPTIDEAIANRLTMRLGGIGKYLVPLITLQLQPRLGFRSQELRPIDKIVKAQGAVFVIHGAIDKHTTLSESKRLFENAHEPKVFWKVEGAAHIDICKFKVKEYSKRVLAFFDNYL